MCRIPNKKSHPVAVVFSSKGVVAQSLAKEDPFLQLHIIDDDALSGFGAHIEFEPSKLSEMSRNSLKQAEILVSEPFVVAKLLEYDPEALTSLKWCQSTYAGVDTLCNANIQFPSWKLTRFAGCFGPPISEWTIARIIEHERGFAASLRDQREKSFAKSKEAILNYRYLSSLTLAVLGCGDIGKCIAKAAKAFGMKTVGFGRTQRPNEVIGGIDQYTTNIGRALGEADYIVSILPSTPETRYFLNGTTLKYAAKKRPIFINVGRGDVISEESMITALDQKWISHAILDVFEVEPLPKESKLWDRNDITISPHVSGLSQAEDVSKIFLENYKRYENGEKLKYEVDLKKGY